MRSAWLLGALALVACSGGDSVDPLLVRIDTGSVRGVDDEGVRAFLGIPYAAPPIGENRFRAPQPVAPWTEVRDAVMPGSPCPQDFALTAGGEEDCLTLNVWSPPGAQNLPVMVWLHGGGFFFGSGGEPYYAGTPLVAKHGVIVVTLNYRLGALGFMAHPAFTAEDPAHPSSGNWGLEDQHAALEWVQRNIAVFGGDPGQVTLFGESAGAISTCIHYLSRRTTGLFQRAITESGICSMIIAEPLLVKAESDGQERATTKLGCPGRDAAAATCLRGKTTDEILAAWAPPETADQQPGGPFYDSGNWLGTSPNIDGITLTQRLRTAFVQGAFEPRPLLIGTNRDEGTLFQSFLFSKAVANDVEYRAAIARRFGQANVGSIAARYPVESFSSANRALAEISGDAFFVCPSRATARGAAAAGAPVYYYTFDREPEGAILPDLGAYHTAEIPFVFGSDPLFPLATAGESNASLVDAVQTYWAQFAKTGDPNGAGLPTWPTYPGDRHLVLDATIAEGTNHKSAICDFWDTLVVP